MIGMKLFKKFRKAQKPAPAAQTPPQEDAIDYKQQFLDACRAAGLPTDRDLRGDDLAKMMEIANRLTVEREIKRFKP